MSCGRVEGRHDLQTHAARFGPAPTQGAGSTLGRALAAVRQQQLSFGWGPPLGPALSAGTQMALKQLLHSDFQCASRRYAYLPLVLLDGCFNVEFVARQDCGLGAWPLEEHQRWCFCALHALRPCRLGLHDKGHTFEEDPGEAIWQPLRRWQPVIVVARCCPQCSYPCFSSDCYLYVSDCHKDSNSPLCNTHWAGR